MPELPEVEVVRTGIARWAAGREVVGVDVEDDRSLRRHAPGVPGSQLAVDFRSRLIHQTLGQPRRRGKYLWIPLSAAGSRPGSGASADAALMIHLGMSGQVLVEDRTTPAEKHLKISLDLAARPGAPDQLRFVDQRIFGGMQISPLEPSDHPSGSVPAPVAHIAPDPFEALTPESRLDASEQLFRGLRRRRTGLKRALLDQTLISGVGNIYADEALWRAQLHFARRTETMTRSATSRLFTAVHHVMSDALAAGGTSFDSLYVNVNGASGYFDRSLQCYGQEGRPCSRCAEGPRPAMIRRSMSMGRSSYWCPVCQPRPRQGRW